MNVSTNMNDQLIPIMLTMINRATHRYRPTKNELHGVPDELERMYQHYQQKAMK